MKNAVFAGSAARLVRIHRQHVDEEPELEPGHAAGLRSDAAAEPSTPLTNSSSRRLSIYDVSSEARRPAPGRHGPVRPRSRGGSAEHAVAPGRGRGGRGHARCETARPRRRAPHAAGLSARRRVRARGPHRGAAPVLDRPQRARGDVAGERALGAREHRRRRRASTRTSPTTHSARRHPASSARRRSGDRPSTRPGTA